jgi:steroid delta-isomerase-like uncharacterized protein
MVAVQRRISGIVAGIVEAVNSHDVSRMTSICAADYEGIDVSHALPQRGRDEARLAVEEYLKAFPDLQVVEHECLVQGDRAAFVWVARGTHRGVFMHIPPTGKEVIVRGSSLLHFQGGEVRKAFHIWDVAAMLREIGLLPEL